MLALAFTAVSPGCERDEQARGSEPSHGGGASRPAASTTARSIEPPEQEARVLPLLSESTFDLTVRQGTAVLVRAVPPAERGALRVTYYDDRARALSTQRLAAPAAAPIVELGAVADEEDIAIAWLSEHGGVTQAHALVSASSAERLPKPIVVGPAARTRASRSHLAVAAVERREQPTRFMAFYRASAEPCPDGAGACTPFHLVELDGQGASTHRVALTVPEPCSGGVAGFSTADGRLYYGVCARQDDGEPTTTMFTIEYEPEYAQAEQLLPGCRPLESVSISGDVLLAADCDGRRRAVRVGHRRAEVVPIELGAVRLRCEKQQLVLRVEGDDGLYAPLSEPVDGLGAFLPRDIAPPGARAAWTGRTLFVAASREAGLSLRAFSCRDGQLREVPAAAGGK